MSVLASCMVHSYGYCDDDLQCFAFFFSFLFFSFFLLVTVSDRFGSAGDES